MIAVKFAYPQRRERVSEAAPGSTAVATAEHLSASEDTSGTCSRTKSMTDLRCCGDSVTRWDLYQHRGWITSQSQSRFGN